MNWSLSWGLLLIRPVLADGFGLGFDAEEASGLGFAEWCEAVESESLGEPFRCPLLLSVRGRPGRPAAEQVGGRIRQGALAGLAEFVDPLAGGAMLVEIL